MHYKRQYPLQQNTNNLQDTDVSIEDIIDPNFLQEFMDAFAATTGVGAVVLGKHTNQVTKPSNFQDLCDGIFRKYEISRQHCLASDAALVNKIAHDGKPTISCCRNGLIDFGAPITLNGNVIGTLVAGQVLVQPPNEEKFLEYAMSIGADISEFSRALERVNMVSEKQIQSMLKMLTVVGEQLSELGYQNFMLEKTSQEKKRAYDMLTTAIESISEGLFTIDRESKIIHANTLALKILGYTRDEILDKSLATIFGTDHKFNQIMVSQHSINDEEITINTPQKRIQCIVSARPFFNIQGSVEGVVFTLKESKKVHKLVNRMVGAMAHFTYKDIIGESEVMKKSIKALMIAGKSPSFVLLLGESGTGKELFAQAIHSSSERRSGPFVAVNCAALPRELIQSELFGYAEGAFTGAKRGGNPGKFELANGGTLFLDEIGDMPIELQVNLLRVLQERKITRLGGDREFPIDVRIISATNKDLIKEVEEGRFRKDLYYRINVFTISIPPLRERGTDIKLLMHEFIKRFSNQAGKKIKGCKPGFLESIEQYSWPGNIRELQNAIEYAINICEGDYLSTNDLPRTIRKNNKTVRAANSVSTLDEMEKDAVQKALRQNNGNITRAAASLGICRNTLYYKIKKYSISVSANI